MNQHDEQNSESLNDTTPHTAPAADGSPTSSRPVRRGRRIVGWSLLGAGVLILLGTAWVGWRGYQAYSNLQAAAAKVSTLQAQLTDVTDVDAAATDATVAQLQSQAQAARSAVDDPVFRAATHLPLVGANLGAVREVALTVDLLATDVMPALVQVAGALQPSQLSTAAGGINVEPLEAISPVLQQANLAVDQAEARMAAIDRSTLVQPIGDAVRTLEQKLNRASEVTEPGARAARLLPPMLGADAQRTYLVVFQNPAELRATGGMFGSYAVIAVDRGTISIVDQGASSRTLGVFDPPVDGLTDAQRVAYTDEMARFPMDVNFTPDFPTAARLFTQMYQQRGGGRVDGVLAIDPVALSYLLRGSPPIDVGDGVTVTSDNLVATLLSTAYEKFDDVSQSERDAFLAAATSKVFEKVMKDGSATTILAGLRKAAAERRVLIYSADPAEQQDIALTSLSGQLTADPATPSIGVFLNDGTGAKLGYYLSNEAHVTPGDCRADGRRELQVRVVMHYDAPVSGLPGYVLGSSAQGKAYTLRTNVLVFAPVGGSFGPTVSRDGAPIGAAAATELSREIAIVTVDLTPGASTDLTYTVLTAPGRADQREPVTPELMLTPGVAPWTTSVDPYSACGISTG